MKKPSVARIVSFAFLCASLLGCQNQGMKSNSQVESMDNMILKDSEEKTISLTFPINGEKVNILKPQVQAYIEAMHEQAKDIENDYILHDFYVTGEEGNNYGAVYSNETDLVRVSDFCNNSINEERSKQVVFVFDAKGFAADSVYKVIYGLKDDLSDGKEITTAKSYVTITNLLLNKTYYWKVMCGEASSKIESFKTDDGFRMITADGINNIRDMGGRPVNGNKHIKQGLIFRGGEMVWETYDDTKSGSTHHANLNEENARVMRDELQIKYEVDLRGDEESNNLIHSPLYDEENYSDIDYLRVPNMGAYDYFFKMGKSDARWQGVKNMFLAFKNAESKHVYFHCWGGADRTGTAGFLLGGLLGMSYTDLVIDFELTSFSCNYRPHHMNDPKKVYRFPALIYQMKNATNTSGEKYYSEDKTISQIIEEILIDKAGLTAQDILDIKTNLLEE